MVARTQHVNASAGAKNPKTATIAGGSPPMLPLDLIDEDPGQPRSSNNPGFSAQSIAELAASFGPNGPKSPISVRDNPDKPGRYLINHGARRTRAARVKGLRLIPGFIDNDYSKADQVIENLQRDELTPREIADWIGGELAKGIKRSDIAKSIGKSAAFVTQHATLLDLPEPIAAAFYSSRVNDVTVVNELVTAYKRNPKEVNAWLGDGRQEVTRGEVKLLREFLEKKRVEALGTDLGAGDPIDHHGPDEAPESGGTAAQEKLTDPDKIGKAIVLVEHNGRPARLNLKRRPAAVGSAWLKYEDDGQEIESALAEVKLIAVIEGST